MKTQTKKQVLKFATKKPSHLEVYGADAIYKKAQEANNEEMGIDIEHKSLDAVFSCGNQLTSEYGCNGNRYEIKENVFIGALYVLENGFLFATTEDENGNEGKIYEVTINGFRETEIKDDEINFHPED